MDNRDYVRVLLYSYYTTITGWGVLLRFSWFGASSFKHHVFPEEFYYNARCRRGNRCQQYWTSQSPCRFFQELFHEVQVVIAKLPKAQTPKEPSCNNFKKLAAESLEAEFYLLAKHQAEPIGQDLKNLIKAIMNTLAVSNIITDSTLALKPVPKP